MTQVRTDAEIDVREFLRPGDHIVVGQACGEPTSVVEALIAQGRDVGDLTAFVATSFSGIFTPESAESFALSSMGAIGALQVDEQGAPPRRDSVPRQSGRPDDRGRGSSAATWHSFRSVPPTPTATTASVLSATTCRPPSRKARVVIAEVNDQVPFTFGEMLPESRIDYAVHVSRPPVEVQPAKDQPRPTRRSPGTPPRFIGDGSVLQIGVGAVPDAILRLLLRPQGSRACTPACWATDWSIWSRPAQ